MLERLRPGAVLLASLAGLALLAVVMLPPRVVPNEWALDARLAKGATLGCSHQPQLPAARSVPSPQAIKVLEQPNRIYAGLFQTHLMNEDGRSLKQTTGTRPSILFTHFDFPTSDVKQSANTFPAGDIAAPHLQQAKRLWEEDGTIVALAWAIYCCEIAEEDFWYALRPPSRHFHSILTGKYDELIRRTAIEIKELGVPIMLTAVPEFNWQGQFAFGRYGDEWIDQVDDLCGQYGDPTWPDGPERIRDVFRHLIDLFRQEDVANVTWFMYAATNYMAPSVDGQSQWLHPKYYYPGDDYIDWVGQSVHFTHPDWGVEEDEPPLTFDAALENGYAAWTSVTDKPLLISEFGAIARLGADRSDHLEEILTGKIENYPRIKALAWTQSKHLASDFGIPSLNGSGSERDTWQRIVTDKSRFAAKVQISQ